MIYADYHYYTKEFGGSSVPETNWNRAAGAASDWMDAATFGRLTEGIPPEWETQVRRCCCELAEQMDAVKFSGNAEGNASGKASEKIGACSVTYRSMAETTASLLHGTEAGLEDLLYNILRKHLGRTGLLYRGVN